MYLCMYVCVYVCTFGPGELNGEQIWSKHLLQSKHKGVTASFAKYKLK